MKENRVEEKKLKIIYKTDCNYAVVGEKIKCYIDIINKSSNAIGFLKGDEIRVLGNIPPELEFVKGSVVIDGKASEKDSILSGISIGTLDIEQSRSIEFEFKVSLYSSSVIKNSINVTYGERYDNGDILLHSEESNKITINTEKSNIKIIKEYSKEQVSLYDQLECKVTLFNDSSIKATNINYKEEIGVVLELIQGTFSVNGKIINNADINKGIYIGELGIKESMEVRYILKLVSANCQSTISNKSTIEYNYILPNNFMKKRYSKVLNESINYLKVNISTFKQINIENYLTITNTKPLIKEINSIVVNTEKISSSVIRTSKSKSNEGQVLSGYKLIIAGRINEVVEYTACNEIDSVHSEEYIYPFSTYIVLAENFQVGSKIEIETKIEDVIYKRIDEKCFYQNISLLVIAKKYT